MANPNRGQVIFLVIFKPYMEILVIIKWMVILFLFGGSNEVFQPSLEIR